MLSPATQADADLRNPPNADVETDVTETPEAHMSRGNRGD